MGVAVMLSPGFIRAKHLATKAKSLSCLSGQILRLPRQVGVAQDDNRIFAKEDQQ